MPLIVFRVRDMLTTAALTWQNARHSRARSACRGSSAGGWCRLGLIGRVEVAQERLATHLLVGVDHVRGSGLAGDSAEAGGGRPKRRSAGALAHLASLVIVLVLVQIGFGGLVAGLRAGEAYNTWPLMDGHLLLPGDVLGAMSPLWRNLVDNVAEVQFQHRMTAYLLLGRDDRPGRLDRA